MTEQPSANVVTVTTGLCFIALGVLLILHRADVLEIQQIIQLWPLALVVLGGAIVWQAMRGGASRSDSGGAIAALVWLGLAGLLFSSVVDRRERVAREAQNEGVGVFGMVAGDRQVDEVSELRRGYVTTVMGGAQLDFTNTTIPAGETAVLDVFNVLGGTDIRVPADWNVMIDATTIAGGVQDERARSSGDGAAADAATGDFGGTPEARPRLIIKGTVILGGVNIR